MDSLSPWESQAPHDHHLLWYLHLFSRPVYHLYGHGAAEHHIQQCIAPLVQVSLLLSCRASTPTVISSPFFCLRSGLLVVQKSIFDLQQCMAAVLALF